MRSKFYELSTMCTHAPSQELTFASNWQLFQSNHQLPKWLELREAQGRWHGFARDGQHLRGGPEGLGQGEARFQVFFTPLVSVHKVPGSEGSASGGSGPTGRASHRSKV